MGGVIPMMYFSKSKTLDTLLITFKNLVFFYSIRQNLNHVHDKNYIFITAKRQLTFTTADFTFQAYTLQNPPLLSQAPTTTLLPQNQSAIQSL